MYPPSISHILPCCLHEQLYEAQQRHVKLPETGCTALEYCPFHGTTLLTPYHDAYPIVHTRMLGITTPTLSQKPLAQVHTHVPLPRAIIALL